MTDKQIIKALEKCTCETGTCEGCVYVDDGCLMEDGTNKLTRDALDLINRQKAEIEILKTKLNNKYRDCVFVSSVPIHKDHIRDYSNFLYTYKHEAIKEFAERLKEEYAVYKGMEYVKVDLDALLKNIDNLVKEMVGD